MPTYSFRNTNTQEEFEEFMSISSLDTYLAENPHLEQIPTAAAIVDPVRMGRMKPDDSFRDLLRNVKKKHRGSNVNTF